MNWAESKILDVQNKLEKFSKNYINNVCFITPWELRGENDQGFIFNPEYFTNISDKIENRWEQIYLSNSLDKPCLYIITAHGDNFSDSIWDLRTKAHHDSVICLWHFDNHMSYLNNYKSALCSDINFLSHNLKVDSYLLNPHSPLAGHIPACTCQFGPSELNSFNFELGTNTRISKALFNYVIYDTAPRSSLIKNLQVELNDIADFKLMPSIDRSRYWNLTRLERYAEWASYKCSVIIPMAYDLSTRVFDCLATGMIPIVPLSIADLDIVLDTNTQAELGIVRIDDLSTQNIRNGILKAIDIFDYQGSKGIDRRVNYVINNATIGDRVNSILQIIDEISKGNSKLKFGKGPNGIGTYLVSM